MRERVTRALVAQLVVVSIWLGAAILFATSVAPAAFATLPSRDLAGALVGRVLPIVFWSGAATGAILLLAALAGPETGHRRTRIAAGALIAASCLIAQLAIAPRIAELRRSIGQPLAALAADDPEREAFGRLHLYSVAWLAVAMVSSAITLGALAFTLDRKDTA